MNDASISTDFSARQDLSRKHRAPLSHSAVASGVALGAFMGVALGTLFWSVFLRPQALMRALGGVNRLADRTRRNPNKRLIAKIRMAIEPVVSNPGAITVQVLETGRVIVKGPILKSEIKAVLSAIYSVEGVRDLSDHLEVHETSAGVPGLQGHREWDHNGYHH